MRQRKLVAACVLAASMAMPAIHSELRGEVGLDAEWAYALGMRGREALAFAVGGAVMCGFIPNPGGVACGIAGAV